MTLLTGCILTNYAPAKATVGERLVDLQKAKHTGAITEAEYQTQKTKILEEK
ncbi:MAG: hypothetical protein ORN51_14850 [Akkermansiaceae bacterium]|nr:hypothetical protein [Akkermansiaceae bacterium]